jgi:hypothetical protein
MTSPNKTNKIFTCLSVFGNGAVSMAAVTLFLSSKDIRMAATNNIAKM